MQPSIIRKNEIMRSQSVHNEEMIDVIYYFFLNMFIDNRIK